MSDLDAVRDWVGAEPDDGVIYAALDRWTGDPLAPDRAALSILERRHADLLASPDTWTVQGDYSEQWGQVIAMSERRLGRLRALTGQDTAVKDAGLPLVTVAQLARPDPSRWRYQRGAR